MNCNNFTFRWHLIIVLSYLFLSGCSSDKIDINSPKENYYFTEEILANFTSTDQAREFADIGEYEAVLRAFDKGCKPKNYEDEFLQNFKRNYKPINASEYILQQADLTKILIINRLKHRPFNHLFIKNLLKNLYDLGYRHMGFEGILNEIKSGDCLIFGENIDDKNPQFVNLVRTAIKIGYSVFPIEYYRYRQHKNMSLIRNITRSNPETKILIYSGLVNSNKTNFNGGSTLAYTLKRELGINPLTVNQAFFSERGSKSYEHFIYKNIQVNQSSVFVDSGGNIFNDEALAGLFDIMVFHPRTSYQGGRPNWMIDHYVQTVKVDLKRIDLPTPYMLFAIKKDKCQNAIPYDVIEIKEGQEEAFLCLPEGDFNIILTNGKEESRLVVLD